MRRFLSALALGAVLACASGASAQNRPIVVGYTTTVYNASVGAAWTQVARATLDDVPIGPYGATASGDVISYLKVVNTHATQTLRVRFAHDAAAGASDGDLVRAGEAATYSLYGQRVVEVSLYGSGAATTGVVAVTWSKP